MNFVAHVEVAHRVRATATPPEESDLSPVLVGAALPDFAAIGGFRLEPGATDGEVAEGIRLHHRADDAFHADDRFRALMGRLRTALTSAGVGRGAARACGHVGIELLLDGRLLAEQGVADRADALLGSIGRPSDEVLDTVAGARRASWEAHLVMVADRIDPSSYRIADLVAARLHRILSHRPRLALDQGDVELLAGALRGIQPAVDEVTHDLVADTASAVVRSLMVRAGRDQGMLWW
jgi:hypothetical protein